MAAYETTQAVDDVDMLRQHFEMTKEQHTHMRANLKRRLKEAVERLERECKEMSTDLDRINAMFPDTPALPADYGMDAPARRY